MNAEDNGDIAGDVRLIQIIICDTLGGTTHGHWTVKGNEMRDNERVDYGQYDSFDEGQVIK